MGINWDDMNNGIGPEWCVNDGQIYAIWAEVTNGINRQARVVGYDGNDGNPTWSFVDGNGTAGINYDPVEQGMYVHMTSFNNKLYAAWSEGQEEFMGDLKEQLRVAVFNGNNASPSWSFVDGNGATGLNYDTNEGAMVPILVGFNNKLYVGWHEEGQLRVAVNNGTDSSPSWAAVDGNGANGINKDPSKSAGSVRFHTFNGKLYATWMEDWVGNDQIRVAVYNGNDSSPSWSFVDGNGVTGCDSILSAA